MPPHSKKSFVYQSVATLGLLLCLNACGGQDGKAVASTADLGDQLHSRGDDVSAANFYQRALQTDPSNTHARLALAEIFEAHNDNAAASVQYTILLQSDPDNGDYHRDLGRLYIKQGQAGDAKGEYEKALAIDSGDTKAMNGLGIALDYLGNHAAAQASYKNALHENSDDLTSMNNLAHSYVLTGAYSDAIALLEPHVRDKNATPALRQNLAEAYGMAGMDVDAERVARIDLTPDQVKHNLAYYRSRREQLSVAPKFYADLGSFPTEAMAQGRIDDVRAAFAQETNGLVITVTPEVKAVGGTPAFNVRALGFTNAAKVRIFCDKLTKQNVACTAHG